MLPRLIELSKLASVLELMCLNRKMAPLLVVQQTVELRYLTPRTHVGSRCVLTSLPSSPQHQDQGVLS